MTDIDNQDVIELPEPPDDDGKKTVGKQGSRSRGPKPKNITNDDMSTVLQYTYNTIASVNKKEVEFVKEDFKKESTILTDICNKSDFIRKNWIYITALLVLPMLYDKYKKVKKDKPQKPTNSQSPEVLTPNA